jgi:arylsulfatase A-like enzyme
MIDRHELNARSAKLANVTLACLCCGLLAPLIVAAELPAEARIGKPNVLVFLIDDLGRSDVGVDGSPFHETPHLDALAKSGVRFTDFYSAHPVCSPTRAALMTGKAPQRVGITDWIHPASGVSLSSSEITLGEAFRSHGYQTAYLGKWHLGEADADQPTEHGFEWIRGVNRAGHPGSYYHPFKRPGTKPTIWDVPNFENGQHGDYLTDVLTSSAIEFLKQHDPQRPFFMCCGHYAVHMPIQPPTNLPKKYEAKRAQLYRGSPTPVLSAPFDAVSRGRQDDADYAAMIENLDANVGRVLSALEDLGLREETIVVFTSDNGGLCTLTQGQPGPTSNLPWRSGKGWCYEGGIRIPTFVSWPGHVTPTTTSVPGYTADLYPTLLELCGLPPEPQQHVDGRSLVSVLQGTPDKSLGDRPLAWYYPHDHGSGHRASAAIRRGSWKLIYYLANEQTELYDLATDPGETKDLRAVHSDKAESLRDELLSWIDETNQ